MCREFTWEPVTNEWEQLIRSSCTCDVCKGQEGDSLGRFSDVPVDLRSATSVEISEPTLLLAGVCVLLQCLCYSLWHFLSAMREQPMRDVRSQLSYGGALKG